MHSHIHTGKPIMAASITERGSLGKKNFRKGRFRSNRRSDFHDCEDLREEGRYFKRKKIPNIHCEDLREEGRYFQRKKIPNIHNSKLLRGDCVQQNIKCGTYKQQNKEPLPVENEMYEYFDRVSERLKIGFDDNEEKAVFMANVVEQTNHKEVELACNRTTSHTLEMLLATCEDSVIVMKFAEAFSSSLRQICTNQYGSHVIESLLSCGMKIIKKYTENGCNYQEEEVSFIPHLDITSWILKFGKFCLNNVEHFLGHIYASHVLRALIEVWSGVKMEQSVRRSKRSISQRKKFQNSEENPISIENNKLAEPTEVEVPEEFVSQLKEFYRKIAELNNLLDCCIDAKVSPILQTLLIGLQKRTPKLCQKFIKLLMKNVIIWKDEEKIPIALTNKSSSCVMEKAILVADEKRQKWIWKHCFKNYMKPLGLHPIANFIVQRLFATIKGKEQFEEMFNEVSPNFEEILSFGYNGVIVSIAEACVRLGICQAPFMQIIMKTLQCLEPEQRQLYLVPLAIQLSTHSIFEESDKMSENSMLFKDIPLSYHGSLLLQNMLKFHKPIKVVKSMLFLKDDLNLIACDAKGSHVLESFLTAAHVGEKNRDKLLHILKPHLLSLACDKFGSRVLDSLWTTASLKQRILISQELSAKESELNDNIFGRYISRKCGLFYFKTRNNDWKQIQNTETKKRKMFNDILS